MSTRARPALTACLGPVAAAISVLALAACHRDPTPAEQREQVLEDVYAAYDAQLGRLAPAFVVLTYPADLRSMSAVKHAEMLVVRRVLADRQIAYELTRHDASVVTLVNERHWQRPEYQAYLVPDAAVARCRDETLLYLNLDVRASVHTGRHPVAVDNDITVKVWNDPITLPPQLLRLWASGGDQAATP